MTNKKKNNNLITRKDLEQTSQTIIKAVDFVVKKQIGGLKTDVGDLKEDNKIIKFDIKGLKKEMLSMEERLGKKIDSVQTLIDGYVKAQEEFKQEFVIMKEEMRIIKQVIKQKLGVEIKAI
jgi:regulator of replication initiation timing